MKIIQKLIITIIILYQNSLSLFFGPCCRFYPSCSIYAKESITQFGLAKGMKMTIKRVLKCHPFHPGGYDPVKEKITIKIDQAE